MAIWGFVTPVADLPLTIGVEGDAVIAVWFRNEVPGDWRQDDSHPLVIEMGRQLKAYFAGQRRDFDIPLELRGTEFQKRVWQALLEIPYGSVISYAELAQRVESPKGFRAVGAANGQNPIAIVVPCHRVINSGGKLGGYGGGLPLKQRLLELEGINVNGLRRSVQSIGEKPVRPGSGFLF